MELEMLKQKWNEMDARLTNVETVNRKTVHELIRTRTRSTVDHLLRTESWGLTCSVFIPLFIGWALNHEPVVSFWTIVLIAACIYLYIPFQARRVSLLSQYRISDSTTNLMSIVLKYRKTINIERLMIIPVTIILSYGLILTEHEWTFLPDKLWKCLLLMTFLCVVVIASQRNAIQRNLTVLEEIEESLKEIEEE